MKRDTIDYVIVEDLPTLVWAANLASLELHVEKNGRNWGKTGRTVDAHRLTAAWTETGSEVVLTRYQFDLLSYLIMRPGRAVKTAETKAYGCSVKYAN